MTHHTDTHATHHLTLGALVDYIREHRHEPERDILAAMTGEQLDELASAGFIGGYWNRDHTGWTWTINPDTYGPNN
jgi:hypothetical protein